MVNLIGRGPWSRWQDSAPACRRRRVLDKNADKKNGTPQGAVSLSTQTITRRRRAAQPKLKQLAGLPSLAARRPYRPSLAAAVPGALPLPTLPSLCERGGMPDPYRPGSGDRR